MHSLSGKEQCTNFFDWLLQFNIHWNQDNLLYVPAQYIDGCIISATSPAPSAVRNLTVKSHRLTTQNEIELSFTWNPPAVINGKRIVEYQVCIGPDPLEPQESPQSNSRTLCQVTTVPKKPFCLVWCSGYSATLCILTGNIAYTKMTRATGQQPLGEHLSSQVAILTVSTSKWATIWKVHLLYMFMIII